MVSISKMVLSCIRFVAMYTYMFCIRFTSCLLSYRVCLSIKNLSTFFAVVRLFSLIDFLSHEFLMCFRMTPFLLNSLIHSSQWKVWLPFLLFSQFITCLCLLCLCIKTMSQYKHLYFFLLWLDFLY